MLHISISAERLWTIFGLPISNAFLTTWIVMGLLIVLAVIATRKMSLIPSNAQLIAESLIGSLHDVFGAIAGTKINQFFPLVATLFLFILTANWIGLLPGVGTVGFYREETEAGKISELKPVVPENTATVDHAVVTSQISVPALTEPAEVPKDEHKTEFVPLFRAATADLNMTLALAIVAVLAMQYFGFRNLGTHYLGRFINFRDPIMFSVGLLEIVSDISKVLSFAFRLFGNIFAGEVLLAVIAFLIPFIVPLPFLMMEIFVGFIQAFVFSMLTTAFLSLAVSHGEGEHKIEAHA
ncbi:MAG TPA: F0F1 ATP synthase subunit A [Patescibacteria group bacterium]|nr:F0F1 ATP synthase subunit A [Patescibacteria group bacterium]